MDFDFTRLSADELFLARKGQIAAREGAPFDDAQTDGWKAGWLLAAGAELTPTQPRWVSDLSAALAAPNAEVTA